MRKKGCLMIFLLCIGTYAGSQNIGIPPSPNAVALGTHQVDLFTGSPDISIPLVEVEARGYKLPIYLRYNSSGHKVETISSWVGLGFSLYTGGFITRIVRGVPDDYKKDDIGNPQRGMLHSVIATEVYNFDYTDEDRIEKINLFMGGGIYPQQDTEPDIFYYNINGKTGEFYFDHTKKIKDVPHSNIHFNYTLDANKIASFTLTDDDGTIYIFSSVESSAYNSEGLYPIHSFGLIFPFIATTTTTYNSTWYITQIITPYGKEINFEYENESYNYNLHLSSSARNCSDNTCSEEYTSLINVDMDVEGKRLSKISSDDIEIDFLSGNIREDLPGTRRLDKIVASNKRGTKIKQWDFGFEYFISEGGTGESYKRLKLESLKEYNGSIAKRPYTFHYNLNNKLPERMSMAQDLWGYYNGKDDAVTLIPKIYIYTEKQEDRYRVIPDNKYTGETYILNGADRRPVVEKMDAFILERIDNPEGGNIQYTYGPHHYYYDGNEYIGGGLRVEKVILNDGNNTANNIIKNYGYSDTRNPEIATSGRLIDKPIFAFHLFDPSRWVAAGPVIDEYFNDRETYYKRNTSQINTSAQFGGFGPRIAYEEVEIDLGSAGSSKLFFEFPGKFGCLYNCGDDYRETWIEEAYASNPSFGGGKSCTYILPGANIRGHNIYPFAPSSNFSWNRGMLRDRFDYDENGNLLREVNNDYEILYKNGGTTNYLYGLKIGLIIVLNDQINCDGSDCPICPSQAAGFIYGKYKIHTDVKKVLKKSTEKIYDTQSLTKFQEVSKMFSYNTFGQLSNITLAQSNGTIKTISYKYPTDYIPDCEVEYLLCQSGCLCLEITPACIQCRQACENKRLQCEEIVNNEEIKPSIIKMYDRHIISPIIEQKTTIKKDATEKVVAADLTEYKADGNLIVPGKTFSFRSNEGITGFTDSKLSTTGAFQFDSRYKLETTFDKYDTDGNVLGFSSYDGLNSSYIYGYNNTYPIAKVINAAPNEIAYTSFEDETAKGGWEFEYITNSHSDCGTQYAIDVNACNEIPGWDPNYGVCMNQAVSNFEACKNTVQNTYTLINHDKKSGTLSFHRGSISKTSLPIGNYVVSFWARRRVENTAGTISGSISANVSSASWKYYRFILNNVTAVNLYVDSDTYIDELRLYPQNARMTSYTYDPLVGVTSISDENGNSTNYTYDSFGRLNYVQDHKDNIVEQYEYHYKE